MKPAKTPDITGKRGLLIALVLLLAWGAWLTLVLSVRLEGLALLWAVPLAAVMTFLATGLFITAHDSMHGLVAPWSERINSVLGGVCVTAYALFSFRRLLVHHEEHHRHPASHQDPDFHDGTHSGFFRWYLHFLLNYVTWKQILGMAFLYNVLKYGAGIPDLNLLCFWVLPLLLSTLQLFYFGTYLPHREFPTGYTDRHRARSNEYSLFWSFLSCYHFGYHWEHHAYPSIPWWALPRIRAWRLHVAN